MHYIPTHFIQVSQRLGITLLMLTVIRILFYVIHIIRFPDVVFSDFLSGIWFDAITIGIWFIPFYTLSLIPNPWRHNRFYQIFLKVLFHITNAVVLGLNLIDLEYFKYTSKRSTSDLFSLVGTGDDFSQQIGAFTKDFWWIMLLWVIMMFMSEKLYRYTKRQIAAQKDIRKLSFWGKELIVFIMGTALFFIIGRGGLGFRPADMLTAAQFTKPENTALITNTGLSIIKTIGKPALKEVNYLAESDIYNPVKKADPIHALEGQPNVMVIILESFGNEWLGAVNDTPFTPFLDSLLEHSLYFTNAFANGKKSIEAMPAIFASIPTLLDNPYISSHYGANTIEGLPRLLKQLNYSSAFFHGATNGSMKFDEFAQLAGFDHYFGRNEYNNEEHCDDTWGVLDEYFNPWTAEIITEHLEQPFLAGLFTLSSHHPYYIPEQHRAHLPKGPEPIAQSIAYGDMSLKLFFEKAKEQPWFNNTIFVLCADHTPAGTTEYYTNPIGRYRIPIAFYTPNTSILPKKDERLFSQIDIHPSILELVGYPNSYYAFGNSFLSDNDKWVANYIGGTYHFLKDDYILNYVQGQHKALYNYQLDSLLRKDSIQQLQSAAEIMEHQLKGTIQRYNRDLIYNKMTAP